MEVGMAPASSATSEQSPPDNFSLRELTLRSVVIGLVLSVVMGAANVYLGLKAGMTVSASIPAAVVGMLLLRALPGRGTILEANQIQTAASAGESLAAGIIFTMPALILIGVWTQFDWLTTSAVAFAGGLLGILFMVPMRRVFIRDSPELPYPEGVACAAVLHAGIKEGTPGHNSDSRENSSEDNSEAKNVLAGAAVGAVFKALISYAGILKGTLEAATTVGAGRTLFFGADISPALVAVGFIVRLNVAVLILFGGVLGWLVSIPLFDELLALLGAISPDLVPLLDIPSATGSHDAVDRAWGLWSKGVRYMGVGAMLVGGISSIIKVRGGLVRAISELRHQLSSKQDATIERTDRDLPAPVLIGFAVLAVIAVAAVYYHFTGGLAISLLSTGIMVTMSFFFVAVAAYIVGLVGNSNSPVSGMTITAVLFTGAMLWICGFSGTTGMVATLGVAAIVCCAACTSGDVCNDLKTGSLVGATPRNQQIMQIAGVAIASLVMAPVMQLLHNAYTIGSRELSAPQAGLFASLARGFFGDGKLPWGLVILGAVLGLLILLLDKILQARGSKFRAHLMPVAVGIYLPFGLSVPIVAGGLLAHFHGRHHNSEKATTHALQRGVLFSSGIIAGEALLGVLIALMVSVQLKPFSPEFAGKGWLTFAAACSTLWIFWRRSRPAA